MTTTLQQALLKAGLVANKKLPEKKPEKKTILKPAREERPKPSFKESSRPLGFIEKKHIHHLRTDCEACKKSGPDVEYYEHRNKILDVRWLCVKCADYYNISDEYRQTMQSQFAMGRRFIRGYGATKVFK